MVTDVEMSVLEELKYKCDERLSQKIVDVVQDMLGELDDDGFRTQEEQSEFIEEYAEDINNIVRYAIDNGDIKKKAADYEILNTFEYGNKTIFLGENSKAENKIERYIVGDCTFNGLFEHYENCLCSDSYNEIVELYSQRIAEQIQAVKDNLAKFPYDRTVIGKEACDSISGVDLKDKVIVIDPEVIKKEYVGADRQIYLASGGFGCSPGGSGRKVYCKNVFTGAEVAWLRQDVLGTIKPECMPEWAKEGLAALEKETSVDGRIKKASAESEKTDTNDTLNKNTNDKELS